jgi:hypothetical protein
MNGYSVKLPLKYDDADGPYSMNKNLKDVVNQNFRMLLLTNPGERMMIPSYGIGVKSLLFHNRTASVSNIDIEAIIRSQVARYMSFINITDFVISDVLPDEQNAIFISISYEIPSINDSDNISLILNQN